MKLYCHAYHIKPCTLLLQQPKIVQQMCHSISSLTEINTYEYTVWYRWEKAIVDSEISDNILSLSGQTWQEGLNVIWSPSYLLVWLCWFFLKSTVSIFAFSIFKILVVVVVAKLIYQLVFVNMVEAHNSCVLRMLFTMWSTECSSCGSWD